MGRPSWDNRVRRAVATYGELARGDGYVVPIIAKTDFSFDGRQNGSTQEIPLAVGIDSSAWVSGALLVRVHARNSWTGSATLTAVVDNIMLVPEEPDVIFASSTAVASNNTLGSATAPTLIVQAFAATIGPMLRVRLTYLATGLQGGANTISIGVDLVGRPA